MKKDEIVLITAYTPTIERIDNLRDLVRKIKSLGYSICLITHSNTPQDIIDRCDYFIFDTENEVNTDRDICYWTLYTANNNGSPYFTIKYKPYDVMSTHIVPIMRLMIGGLTYLKCLNHKKVYALEYDSEIINDDIFKKMSIDLESSTISAIYVDELNNKEVYSFGPLIGVNLEKLDPTIMPTDSIELLRLYREYFNRKQFPVTEKIIYDILWSKYDITWNDINQFENSLKYNVSTINKFYSKKNTFVFHIHDKTLYFFCGNKSLETWNFDLLINDKNISVQVAENSWLWIPLIESEKLKTIKVFLDNKFVYENSVSPETVEETLNEWVVFEKHS